VTVLRITSVAAPFDRPPLLSSALSLVRRALGVGLLADRDLIDRLDLDLIRDVARQASDAGVGRDAASALLEQKANRVAQLERLIGRLETALADSPMPERELAMLLRIYDYEGLAALVGASPVSLRRYRDGARSVPDAIADRVHFVALVTSDLAGSYNEFGLRRWWERRRALLGDRSPREALGVAGEWRPDDPGPTAVADLAATLSGSGVAAAS
jgi:hypothetical protein